jgi:hypothetical protein
MDNQSSILIECTRIDQGERQTIYGASNGAKPQKDCPLVKKADEWHLWQSEISRAEFIKKNISESMDIFSRLNKGPIPAEPFPKDGPSQGNFFQETATVMTRILSRGQATLICTPKHLSATRKSQTKMPRPIYKCQQSERALNTQQSLVGFNNS